MIIFSMILGYIFLILFGITIFIVGLILACSGNRIIGNFGERWTREKLEELPNDQYVVLNDIFIKSNYGTHQIDHVVVSPFGIFSIETKQYNGYITGNKYDKKWVRRNWGRIYYYENPIRQNYGHVKALCELLNIDESKIYNIVCIPSRAKLNIEHDGELTRYDTLLDRIMSYNDIIIPNVNEIVEIINRNNIVDDNIKREHVKNIRENIIDNDLYKCPKCGGYLIERNGQYGRFYGCSNYPKCKYTEKIK